VEEETRDVRSKTAEGGEKNLKKSFQKKKRRKSLSSSTREVREKASSQEL